MQWVFLDGPRPLADGNSIWAELAASADLPRVLARKLQSVSAMKVAIPHWQSRVSPVCDEARQFLLVEFSEDRELSRSEREISGADDDLVGRVIQLQTWGVDALICGALSGALEALLWAAGIRVTSQVCGNVQDVLHAFQTGGLNQDSFTLPGCGHCQRRRRRGERCRPIPPENRQSPPPDFV